MTGDSTALYQIVFGPFGDLDIFTERRKSREIRRT
jgi:hypothetical protein